MTAEMSLFPTLQAAQPLMRDPGKTGPVHDAQWLLCGQGRFSEVYYHGALDGVYGPSCGLAAREAKWWVGYPAAECDHVFGPVLYSYLLPLSSNLAAIAPYAYRVRRLARLAAKKRQEQAYRDPYRDVQDLAWAGIDQGVDFSGAGPVYAIGPARVTVVTTRSGWPGGGAVGYTLTAGAKAGVGVYFVENVVPAVRAGQLVTSGTVIARMRNSYPYTESGWAHPATVDPVAPLNPDPHSPKAQGRDFNEFLRHLGTPVGS